MFDLSQFSRTRVVVPLFLISAGAMTAVASLAVGWDSRPLQDADALLLAALCRTSRLRPSGQVRRSAGGPLDLRGDGPPTGPCRPGAPRHGGRATRYVPGRHGRSGQSVAAALLRQRLESAERCAAPRRPVAHRHRPAASRPGGSLCLDGHPRNERKRAEGLLCRSKSTIQRPRLFGRRPALRLAGRERSLAPRELASRWREAGFVVRRVRAVVVPGGGSNVPEHVSIWQCHLSPGARAGSGAARSRASPLCRRDARSSGVAARSERPGYDGGPAASPLGTRARSCGGAGPARRRQVRRAARGPAAARARHRPPRPSRRRGDGARVVRPGSR